MSNYFSLSWTSPRQSANASAPNIKKAGHQLIADLEGLNEMPFDMHLIKITVGRNELIYSDNLSGLKNIWDDYLGNDFAWPLMSEKLKSVIEKELTGEEGIDWISVKIHGNGECRTYYILRFNKELDVLDNEHTMFQPNSARVIVPHFSLEKIKNYSVFTVPRPHCNYWKITSNIKLSEKVKKAIQKAKITAVSFSKTRVH